MNEILPILLAFSAMPLLVLVIFIVQKRNAAKRTKDLYQAGAAVGLSPSGELDATLKTLSALPLFQRSKSAKASNLMQGEFGGVKIKTLDYRYTTGGNKNRTTKHHTVLVIGAESIDLPDFLCVAAPPNFAQMKQMAAMLGQKFSFLGSILDKINLQDIELPDQAKFNDEFILQGSNEEEVRAAFTPEIVDYLMSQKDFAVEAFAQEFIVYRPNQRLPPDALPDLIKGGLGLFAAMQKSAKPTP